PLRRRPPSTLFPYTTLFRSGPMPSLPLPDSVQAVVGDEPVGDVVEVLVDVERIDRAAEWRRVIPRDRHPRKLVAFNRHRDLHDLDRKSTRLNSSHVKISYAV